MSNLNKTSKWVEDRLEDLLTSIQESISLNQRPPHQVVLVDSEVLSMLKISKRTLASLRDNGMLIFSKVGNKIYYKLSDVLDMIEIHKVTPVSLKLRIGKSKDHGEKL